jgi:hypothetical protein
VQLGGQNEWVTAWIEFTLPDNGPVDMALEEWKIAKYLKKVTLPLSSMKLRWAVKSLTRY